MTLKEKFLSLQTEEELMERTDEFRGLVYDEEVKRHLNKLRPPIEDYTSEELYLTEEGRKIGIGH